MLAINAYFLAYNANQHHNVLLVCLAPITIVHHKAVLCNVLLAHFMILPLLSPCVLAVQIHVQLVPKILQTASVA